MGVTAITQVRNNSSFQAVIENKENVGDTAGGKGDVAPGTEKDLNMWIPWCWTDASFWKHHIQIDLGGSATYSIWQANLGGSDRVRVSTDGSWHDPGDPIGGIAQVNGDRILVLEDQGIRLEDNTPSQNPSHQATSGQGIVSFFRPTSDPPTTADPFFYKGNASAPAGTLIDRIRNTAQDVNGNIGVPLDITFQETGPGGRTAGPHHMEPNATLTGDLAGLHVEGSWEARAVNISAALLRNTFVIDLFWNRDLGSTNNPLTGTPQVVISAVRQNPPGSDVQPETGEYVELTNTETQTVDVSGWYLEDERGTRIVIPAGYSMPAGSSMRVYTGPGTNAAYRYYLGRRKAIWNNPGDSIRLFTSTGTIVYALIY